MKKKIVSLTVATAMALSCAPVILAGCGDDISDYEHTIVFYSSQGDTLQQQTKIAIENFEAKYPGWKVSHQTQGDYDDVKTKCSNDLQGDIQPDLAYCYADHVAAYLPTEQVIDMLPFINSTETVKGVDPNDAETKVEYAIGYTADELADFVPGFYAEGKATNYTGYTKYGYSDNSMLTLPFVKSTELMYYNETALKKLGLSVPKTWDELWAQADKVKQFYPNATLLGYDSEANWFITMCEQNGWGYTSADESEHFLFNKNNSELISWLNTLNGYWEAGHLTTKEDYNSYTSALFTKGVENSAGGCVYCIGSSGGASHQQPADGLFKANIAAIPGTKKSDGSIDSSVISQGPSLVMFNAGHGVSNAEEKAKMTFLFIKELLDPTFQAQFSIAAGYNPCRESVYENETYIEHMEGDSLTALACKTSKDLSDKFFTSPAFEKSSLARLQVGTVLLQVMRGELTAKDALEAAYKNCGGKN